MMNYFAIILFMIVITIQYSCSKTYNIYLQTYNEPKNTPLQNDLKLKTMRDTQFVSLWYTGDFGRKEHVYYNLRKALPDGNYKVYINNVLKESETYKNGKKNGNGSKYYDDGSYSTFFYKNDTIAGVALQCYASGILKQRSVFSSGNLVLVSSYSEQAEIRSHTFYINEIAVRTEKFNDSNGEIIIKDQNDNKNEVTNRESKINGQKLYMYPKGNFIVKYSNNNIVDCKWIPTAGLKN